MLQKWLVSSWSFPTPAGIGDRHGGKREEAERSVGHHDQTAEPRRVLPDGAEQDLAQLLRRRPAARVPGLDRAHLLVDLACQILDHFLARQGEGVDLAGLDGPQEAAVLS